jgi:putative hydrolase of the HAD superfamily
MKFNNIEHIYFDLDHTLWDFDKNSALTFEAILKEENIAIDLQEFLDAYIPININYWELYRNNQISKESLKTGRLKDCFETLKYTVPAKTIDILSDKYVQFLPTFKHLLEDTVDILEYLKPKYQLHIITNGFQEVQRIKMENTNILSYFSTITTSEEAGVKKPHPHIFKKALRKSKALPEKSLMIGDSYAADIVGANNAGMKSVYFNYYQKNGNLDTLTILKLKELRSYL